MRLLSAVLAAAALLLPTLASAAEPTRFTVEVRGKGPDVILIPGLTSSREVWADTVKQLEGRHRLHLIQVNGFAGAPAGVNAQGAVVEPLEEEIAAYIADRKLKQPAVIGHSMGGFTGLLLAQRHPEAVGRVMIVDALPFFSVLVGGPSATVDGIKPQAGALRDQMLAQTPEAFAAGQKGTMTRLVKSPEGLEKAVAWSLASDRRVVAQAMYDVMTTDLRSGLAEVKTPITVVYARDDKAMGPMGAFVGQLYQSQYAAVPNKTLVEVDGALHFVMFDQPAAFAKAVDAFLQ